MKLLNVDTVDEVKLKLEEHFAHMNRKTELVPLRAALARYLAEDVISDMDLPEFRRTVVDGYAVAAKDTFGVSESMPVFLDVIGAVEMGKESMVTLKPGQAVYVPTGGMIPEGADAMIMVEYVELLDEHTIAVYKPTAPNSKIMNVGDDFKKGQVIYRAGHRITLNDIGMLAALGKAELTVFKKPVITVLSTGDEIIDITRTLEFGQVRDINSYTLAAFAEDTGAVIEGVSIIKDDYNLLKAAVENALKESDILLLSGGSSAGNKDMTADILDSMGKPGVITHGISMKPGKPTIVGVFEPENGNPPILAVGLPGHPMAAIIAFEVIVKYFIKKFYYNNEEKPLAITARISENFHGGEGRETYQMVRLKRDSDVEWIAEPIHAKSGSIAQLMQADGYIRLPALSEGINANDPVEVILINR